MEEPIWVAGIGLFGADGLFWGGRGASRGWWVGLKGECWHAATFYCGRCRGGSIVHAGTCSLTLSLGFYTVGLWSLSMKFMCASVRRALPVGTTPKRRFGVVHTI